jgi:hypothetical protein
MTTWEGSEKNAKKTAQRNETQSDYLGLVRFESITLHLIPQNECENLICFIFLPLLSPCASSISRLSTCMLLIHKLMIMKSPQLAACSKYPSRQQKTNDSARVRAFRMLVISSLFASVLSINGFGMWKEGEKIKVALMGEPEESEWTRSPPLVPLSHTLCGGSLVSHDNGTLEQHNNPFESLSGVDNC